MSAALAFAFDDGGVFLVDGDALGLAEVVQRDAFELDAEVFGHQTATGQHRDVFQHGLAAVTEAGCLDGGDLQRATELVHHERREGFAFHVFRDDEQRTARLRHLSSSGSRSLRELIFFSWMRMYGLSRMVSMLSAFVTKYGDR